MATVTRMQLILAGDGNIGKSMLIHANADDGIPPEYGARMDPSLGFELYALVTIDGKKYNISLFESGPEDYDRLRPLSYPQTDVFLMCFSVDRPTSFENIRDKWYPEVRRHCPNVPCLIVGCKADLRWDAHASTRTLVSTKSIQQLSKELGFQYFETSAKSSAGLKEAFGAAIKEFELEKSRRSLKGKVRGFGRKRKPLPIAPIMPPAGKAPVVEVETSRFASDWKRILESPRHSDVTFLLNDGQRLDAHAVLLASASEFFRRALGLEAVEENQLSKVKSQYQAVSPDAINAGSVRGISGVVNEKIDGAERTVFTISDEIAPQNFVYILEYLYSGLPNFDDSVPGDEEIENLKNTADIFALNELVNICENQSNDEEFLNPSIGTYLNDETGQRMKQLFFNKPHLADVIFKLNDTKVYAHKAVLGARCEVLSAMFSGSFNEGTESCSEIKIPDVDEETFLALLEFLYTDHAPIEDGDSVGILVLADQYCVPRLVNLCELYITKEVDRAVTKNIEKADIDVISLLYTSERHNAEQLVTWCLHFISSNYIAFENRPDFCNLKGEFLDHVEEHRWPPVSYLNEVQEYEIQMTKQGESCQVM
ncbi:rho-related protein racA-like isoform X2 [Tubulanus polymorphus]